MAVLGIIRVPRIAQQEFASGVAGKELIGAFAGERDLVAFVATRLGQPVERKNAERTGGHFEVIGQARQIGEELNTPIGTIKSALSRALVRLRENGPTEEVNT